VNSGCAGPAARRRPGPRQGGYSLVELMFVVGLMSTVCGFAVPQLIAGLDDLRTAGAVRYLSTKLQQTRMEAVLRGADVALRFVADGASFRYATYVDGNGDGIRSEDIQHGIDRQIVRDERLRDQFPGIDIGALAEVPPVDGSSSAPALDPLKLGISNMASFSALGTSSTGSLYVRGKRAQYVVRIFGETGKTRILKFDPRRREWKAL